MKAWKQGVKMCDVETLGTKLTFEEVYRRPIDANTFLRVNLMCVYLDGKPLGIFSRAIVNSLSHLLKVSMQGDWVWGRLSQETRHLIHAEDRGEYVLLWLNDFTGKKPTRREAILIKA